MKASTAHASSTNSSSAKRPKTAILLQLAATKNTRPAASDKHAGDTKAGAEETQSFGARGARIGQLQQSFDFGRSQRIELRQSVELATFQLVLHPRESIAAPHNLLARPAKQPPGISFRDRRSHLMWHACAPAAPAPPAPLTDMHKECVRP